MESRITALLQTMKNLRAPEGCPWDARQTPSSLKPYIIEEAYELIEAIDGENPSMICDELGDLLLQVVFLSRIFEEQGLFDFSDVATTINEKLIRRHPHVFGDLKLHDEEQLRRNWDRIKEKERRDRGQKSSKKPSIPAQLPALMRGVKVAAALERIGVDQQTRQVEESLHSLSRSIREQQSEITDEALGRHLFELCRLAQEAGIDPEDALRKYTRKQLNDIEPASAPKG